MKAYFSANTRIMRFTFFLALLMIPTLGLTQSELEVGSVSLEIRDEDGWEVPLATVILKQNGAFITGVQSDFDGLAIVRYVYPGNYTLEVSSVGFPKWTKDIRVWANETQSFSVQLEPIRIIGCPIIYKYPAFHYLDDMGGNPNEHRFHADDKVTQILLRY